MRVSDISVRAVGADFVELQAAVRHDTRWIWGDQAFQLWHRYPRAMSQFVTSENGDPFIAAFLVPAMLLGEDLEIEAPVSPALLRNARTTIQDIFCRWDPSFRRIDVRAPTKTLAELTPRSPHRGLFYSLGVDSSYSLLKTLRDDDSGGCSHLIIVEGFDVYLWEAERFVPMLERIGRVAQATGKNVVHVTTNLRDLTDRIADWPRFYCGSAMASTVLGLNGIFSDVKVASSFTYDHLFPSGTHPVLDPLWGTEATGFVHDGCEAGRLDKIRLIASMDVPAVLDNLRVCVADYPDGAYNCGRCEKCVRTMIGLHICSALERCKSLPNDIDESLISTFPISGPYLQMFYREFVSELSSTAKDKLIRATILQALERGA
jgi:hypothetical protein